MEATLVGEDITVLLLTPYLDILHQIVILRIIDAECRLYNYCCAGNVILSCDISGMCVE